MHNTNNYFRHLKNEVLPASLCSSALASNERHILNAKQKKTVHIKKQPSQRELNHRDQTLTGTTCEVQLFLLGLSSDSSGKIGGF